MLGSEEARKIETVLSSLSSSHSSPGIRGWQIEGPWIEGPGSPTSNLRPSPNVYRVAGDFQRGGQAVVCRAVDQDGRVWAIRTSPLTSLSHQRSWDGRAALYRVLRDDPARYPATAIPREVFTWRANDLTLLCEVLPWADRTLGQRLFPFGDAPRRLRPQDAVRLFERLAADLLTLHTVPPKGFIHGDIDESNVLLRDDRLDRAVLSDYSILRSADGLEIESPFVKPHTTPPEYRQAFVGGVGGSRRPTLQTAAWQMGRLLYVMVTADRAAIGGGLVPPDTGATVGLGVAPPRWARWELVAQCGLDDIVGGLTAERPEDRWTLAEAVEYLSEWRAEASPVEVSAPGRYRAPTFEVAGVSLPNRKHIEWMDRWAAGTNPRGAWIVVADGISTDPDGARAASTAVAAAAARLNSSDMSGADVLAAVQAAQQSVSPWYRSRPDGGTTLTVVAATSARVCAAAVGDSPAYRVVDGCLERQTPPMHGPLTSWVGQPHTVEPWFATWALESRRGPIVIAAATDGLQLDMEAFPGDQGDQALSAALSTLVMGYREPGGDDATIVAMRIPAAGLEASSD